MYANFQDQAFVTTNVDNSTERPDLFNPLIGYPFDDLDAKVLLEALF